METFFFFHALLTIQSYVDLVSGKSAGELQIVRIFLSLVLIIISVWNVSEKKKKKKKQTSNQLSFDFILIFSLSPVVNLKASFNQLHGGFPYLTFKMQFKKGEEQGVNPKTEDSMNSHDRIPSVFIVTIIESRRHGSFFSHAC